MSHVTISHDGTSRPGKLRRALYVNCSGFVQASFDQVQCIHVGCRKNAWANVAVFTKFGLEAAQISTGAEEYPHRYRVSSCVKLQSRRDALGHACLHDATLFAGSQISARRPCRTRAGRNKQSTSPGRWSPDAEIVSGCLFGGKQHVTSLSHNDACSPCFKFHGLRC